MKSKKRILVLEAGGACAISCIKLLRKQRQFIHIVAADMDKYAPGLALADESVISPPASQKNYAQFIKNIIKSFSIDLVIPCFEHGFKELKELNSSCFITDFDSALLCKDKLKFFKRCQNLGVPVPKTEILGKKNRVEKFPRYVKPRFGVGSRDNYVVENPSQLKALLGFLGKGKDFLIQDYLTGSHWNIDVFVENKAFIAAVPRRDIKQKEGNCITVEVRDYKKLISFAKAVQQKLIINSPFNLEVFEVKSGEFVINEINVRFGGGIIFSAMSGVNMVSYLATGKKHFLGKIKRGVYSRFYEEIEIKQPSEDKTDGL